MAAFLERGLALAKLDRHAPNLAPVARKVLADLYASEHLAGTEGPLPVEHVTGIEIEQGATLNRLMRERNATRSLEIGFAFGFSTIWMLEAILATPGGLHIAVDPYEKSRWGGVGLAQTARLGPGTAFRWLEKVSAAALPELLTEGCSVDFVFVDGGHRFDDVIVDFYLCDRLLRIGGLLAFDDVAFPSVGTAVEFVISNRSYRVVDQPVKRMVVVEKLGADTRQWDHFVPFTVYPRLQ